MEKSDGNSKKKRTIFRTDDKARLRKKHPFLTPELKKEFGRKTFVVIGVCEIGNERRSNLLGYDQLVYLALASDKSRERVTFLNNAVLCRP